MLDRQTGSHNDSLAEALNGNGAGDGAMVVRHHLTQALVAGDKRDVPGAGAPTWKDSSRWAWR